MSDIDGFHIICIGRRWFFFRPEPLGFDCDSLAAAAEDQEPQELYDRHGGGSHIGQGSRTQDFLRALDNTSHYEV